MRAIVSGEVTTQSLGLSFGLILDAQCPQAVLESFGEYTGIQSTHSAGEVDVTETSSKPGVISTAEKVFSRTLLNFHPCVYDAYGMTIVEAAAFAAPSVVNKGAAAAVGAADLLRIRDGMAIGMNLERPAAAIAEALKAALSDRKNLAAVGAAAAAQAVAWSEEANAKELVSILHASPRLPAVRPGPDDAVR